MLVIAERARTPAGPTPEGTPKVRGLTEAERIGDIIDRHAIHARKAVERIVLAHFVLARHGQQPGAACDR